MKIILLAAAALIAAPSLAQTSGSTGTSSPTSNGGQGTAATPTVQNDTQGTTQTDPATQTPPAPTAPADQSMPMPATDTATAGSVSTGAASTGGAVRFQAPPSVDQAFPAPAPLASYPVCKKGEYDKCMQASGGRATRSRRHR